MSAAILDGVQTAQQMRAEVAQQVFQMKERGHQPALAVILAGDNPASQIYVRSKIRACAELGIVSEEILPPASVTTEELLAIVHRLNQRDDVDGILVQLPLPVQVDAQAVLLAVSPDKDVDGFHPVSVGRLVTRRPGLTPCTPTGIIELLKRNGIPMAGREAVVIGRSDIVGKPMAMLLLHENATVTIAHSRTKDLPGVCQRADILVAAIGQTGMVGRDFIRPGAVVVDVGMNRLTTREAVERFYPGDARRMEEFERRGSTLIGDVDPVAAHELASAFTPVPRGVGPLTIAQLMANTVTAAKARRGWGR